MSCRVARAREWSVRIMHELKAYIESSFLTLTYNVENLPANQSLNKCALQKFLKRLRKQLDLKVRYYACGEYGEKGDRPHYHLIMFGYRPKDLVFYKKSDEGVLYTSLELQRLWPFGFSTVGSVTQKSARYVAEYINKKILGKESDEFYKGREKPFSLMSKGIGLRWAEENADQLREDLFIRISGKKVSIPRYYRKKIDLPKLEFLIKSLQSQEKTVLHHRDRGVHPYDGVKASRRQADLNLKGRLNLRKKKL